MAFPVVDAFLLEPEEGKKGKTAICTNTLAPSMVINELQFDLRSDICVMGSLVVSRDGAERMIINCLAHSTIEYLILFGTETLSFCPSTNLLSALMDGYREDRDGNVIIGGKGVSHHYPNVAPHLLDQFRKRIKVIPLFTHHSSQNIVERYVEWLKPQVPLEVYTCLKSIFSKKKIYYDSLVEMVKVIAEVKSSGVSAVELDAKDFQHLQPPIVQVDGENKKIDVNFSVSQDKGNIIVDIDLNEGLYTIRGTDSFLLAYSLMDYMDKHNLTLPHDQQLWLGVELSRVEMAIRSEVKGQSHVASQIKEGERREIPIASRSILKADKKYYYKMGIKDGRVSVQSLAQDTCESVFELRANRIFPLIDRINNENRFEDYEQQFLHRVDVGIEIGRAMIALDLGLSYFQDFRNLFKINKTNFPYIFVEGDTFLGVHQKIITRLYTQGITESHPDTHKGTMRSATVLACYRGSGNTLQHFPEIYGSASQSAKDMREKYKEQLLSAENKGSYTYGNRTRTHFGKDQLKEAAAFLKKHPDKPFVIQRFDPVVDMAITETPITDDLGNIIRTRLEATHDPCLTHDVYFISEGKLHSFHIARAHNMVNAYPENIFGLHDAYDQTIARELGIELGDMFMLSSRGNMLLLTEEQKAKKLIAEPSKPIEELDNKHGPYDLRLSFPSLGVGVYQAPLEIREERPQHPCLSRLEDYSGLNIISKARSYLDKKGNKHNNSILCTFNPKQDQLIEDHNRLIFFQCNNRGNKLQASAVFVNGTKENMKSDVELCNYLATQYKNSLGLELGNLFLFYVPLRG